ncbi:hypothetical protein D5086_014094 [Populus alba]|uniref:Uncharacterized protein n=1 Tax=Populus alba TaxID=43335 RepID=A0ACC4C7K8_POPAL
MSKQFDVDGLKDCDQLVLDRLQQSSSIGREKGMHMDELCQQLKLPMEKIKESIRSLEDEGLIYSTIDEFHYKAITVFFECYPACNAVASYFVPSFEY